MFEFYRKQNNDSTYERNFLQYFYTFNSDISVLIVNHKKFCCTWVVLYLFYIDIHMNKG